MMKKIWESLSLYISNLLSISEDRASLISSLLLISTFFSMYMYFNNGDISSNWLTFLLTLVGALTGLNVSKNIENFAGIKKAAASVVTEYESKETTTTIE